MVTKTQPAAKTAVPASAEPATSSAGLPVDEYHGVGGSYVIENGVRRRVEGPPVDQPPNDGIASPEL